MQVDVELVRSPVRRQSPKGFVINRPPKVNFCGGGKQKLEASIKETSNPVLGGKKGGRQPQNPVRAGRGSPAPAAVAPAGGIAEQARRRRLILEDDLDDDMVDLPHPKVQASPRGQPTRQDAQPSSYPVRESGGLSTGTVKPVKRRLRRNASKAAASDVGGVAVPAPRLVDAPRKSRQVRVGHGKEFHEQGVETTVPLPTSQNEDVSAGEIADEMASGASEAGVDDPLGADAAVQRENGLPVPSDSEGSGMGTDTHCFEIRKRDPGPTSVGTGRGISGKVSQVVAAFETGLAIDQGKVTTVMIEGEGVRSISEHIGVHGEGAEVGDEYGSNLTNPVFSAHKRSLASVEGEVGSPPTPKKYFIEVANVFEKEKVEEASLEWPQPDK
ncbi:unnamed protein product [Linum trigynum]